LRRTGHFWQGRFGAVAMDEAHLAAALRYVALNPVRARLAARAEDWEWSSARAQLTGCADGITALAPVRARFPDFAALLGGGEDAASGMAFERLRRAETVGRPLGGAEFLARLEGLTQRTLAPHKRGRKPTSRPDDRQGELSGLSP
jgi:putative transposase